MSAAASGGGDDGGKGGEKKMTREEAWLQFVDLHMDMVSSDKDELILKRLSESHPNPTLIKHAHDSSKSSEKLKEMSAGVNEPLMNKSRVVNDVHVISPLPNITRPLQPQHVDDDKDTRERERERAPRIKKMETETQNFITFCTH